MTQPDTESLRVRLAERMGWEIRREVMKWGLRIRWWKDGREGFSLPGLAELVSEAERALNEEQLTKYAYWLDSQFKEFISDDDGINWLHVGRLITASVEARAAALLEVIERNQPKQV